MGSSALIVIDMLNPYEHDDADELAAHVADIVDPIAPEPCTQIGNDPPCAA